MQIIPKITTAFVLLSLFFTESSYSQISTEAIRVRLEKNREAITILGMGVQVFGREAQFEKVSLPRPQKIKISREQENGQAVWKVIRQEGARLIEETVSEKVLAIKGIFLKTAGKDIPQQIFFWPQGRKKFDLIAVLPLEEYLVGVLAGEMPANWPLQTLKAQAIAARSYALSVMQERRSQAFHVESTVMDQVFNSSANKNMKQQQAIRETENLVLTDKGGRIVKTFFHSDCGGKTANANYVWGKGAATDVVMDDSCPTNPKAKWEFHINQQKLNALFAAQAEKSAGDLESIMQITNALSDKEERAYEFELKWKNGFKKNILAQDFRQILGFDKIKSTLFSFKRQKNELVFTGQGYGHGVGLCQWGARSLGLAGKDFVEILKHYYPQANLYMRQYQVPSKILKPELRLGLLKQKVQL